MPKENSKVNSLIPGPKARDPNTEVTNNLQGQLSFHEHNGFDFPKIKIQNLANVLYGKVTWDPPSLSDGTGATTLAVVKGASEGDFVLVATSENIHGMILSGYVKDSNSVIIRLQNETGGTIDLGSNTYRVLVIKRFF